MTTGNIANDGASTALSSRALDQEAESKIGPQRVANMTKLQVTLYAGGQGMGAFRLAQ